MLLDFRRWQANREVSGHKHCWSGACEQAGSGKPVDTPVAWIRGRVVAVPRDPLPQPSHRCPPARGRPPRGRRRRRALLTASSTPRPSRTRRSPSAGSRLPAGRDQPYRHEPVRPRLRCAAAPPRGAAQSGPREPGRAAGPAGARPRDRPAAQPAGGNLLRTHQERRRYPGPDRPAKSGIDALPEQLGRTPLLRGSSRLRADRPCGAERLFQIITERDEHALIRIGTNLPFR